MSWLSFRGRIGRQTFWLAYMLPLFLLSLVISGAIGWMTVRTGGKPGSADALGNLLASPLVNLLLLWPSLAGTVKRLHDRGRSGWWVVVFWLLGILPWIALVVAFFAGVAMHGRIAGSGQGLLALAAGLGILGTIVALWMFIELGFLRGTPGPNRFGPDPLGPAVPPGYGLPPGYGPQQGYYGGGYPPPPPQGYGQAHGQGGYQPPQQPPPQGSGWGGNQPPPQQGSWGGR